VKKHLFVFCYETPEQLATNPMYGWDEEESKAMFIKCESEDAALHWGRKAAQEYVRALFEREGAPAGLQWVPNRYAHWVEPNPSSLLTPGEMEDLPAIKIGQFLDNPEPSPLPSLRLAVQRLSSAR